MAGELTFAALVIPAFIAGLLTFLAPCTLPLIPAYLGFISGVSPKDLEDPSRAPKARRTMVVNGLAFVLGFSVVFVLLGTLIGLVSATALQAYRVWFARIGGMFVVLFGLFMMGIFNIPFFSRKHALKPPKVFKQGNPLNALLLGSAFAVGWTPCVGPVLGSVLVLAGTSATALQGALLLGIFSLGLGIPFILVAAGAGKIIHRLMGAPRLLKAISIIGGLFLVGLGVLLFLNKMELLIAWGFRLLEFINYDRILRYL